MVTAISQNSAISQTGEQGFFRTDLNELFLKIFTAELTQQNPLSPMGNQEWVQQLAQFANVSQMTNFSKEMQSLKDSVNFMHATNLVGKEITYSQDNKTETGKVDSVTQKEGKIFLNIGTKEISLDQLISVKGEKI
ncbi:MAG: hypothetical protein HUU50_12565 [Candidatus Brocadiae bacterium]|nr:hypothetical protein [Candidatus Brocadiia bacterium]